MPTTLESGEQTKAARTAWQANAAQVMFRRCDDCGRDRDDTGRPLLVARQDRGRKFRCFDCFTTPAARRRRNPETKEETMAKTTAKTPAPAGTLEMVPLAKLVPAGDNVRADVGDVAELAQSIKAMGVLQPLTAFAENGHYRIVAGERRYAAAKLAGVDAVPVYVREFAGADRVAAMLVENLQRSDLTPLEEARAFHRLVDEFGMTQRDLAAKIGRSQGQISKRLALLELPDEVQAKVDSGGITIADAVELAKLKDHPDRVRAAVNGPNYHTVAQRVQAQLTEIEQEKKLVAREEELESQAIPTMRVRNKWNLPRGVHRLKTENDYSAQALLVTPAEHAKHSCHAIALHVDYQDTVVEFPVCTDRSQHPKIKTRQEADRAGDNPTGKAQREQQRKAKELEDAEAHRREFIRSVLSKKVPRDVAVAALVSTLLEFFDDDPDQQDLVVAFLGLKQQVRFDDVTNTAVTLAKIGSSAIYHLVEVESENGSGQTTVAAKCAANGAGVGITRDLVATAENMRGLALCPDCLRGFADDEGLPVDYGNAIPELVAKDEATALRVGLALALALGEEQCHPTWYWDNHGQPAHFARLQQLGYEPTAAERAKLDEAAR